MSNVKHRIILGNRRPDVNSPVNPKEDMTWSSLSMTFDNDKMTFDRIRPYNKPEPITSPYNFKLDSLTFDSTELNF